MSDAALSSFIGQIEGFSYQERLSILNAVIHSLGISKKSEGTSKAESLYGLIKDSPYTIESAREERLGTI